VKDDKQNICVLNATAKELSPVSNVMALAKNASSLFQSVTVRNVVEVADAAAMFVVALVK
jgi:hypothetical protein